MALSWGRESPRPTRTRPTGISTPPWPTGVDWLATGTFPDHPWRPYIERSALTLKGLSYAPTGAIMAASTTSLPETPGGARNWDYRYTWIRDTGFMLRSLYRLGFDWEALEYFAFVLESVTQGKHDKPFELQIMYGIGGERDLTERTLDHLSGYDGARPVRVGNGAWDQHQNDVWGMLLDGVDTAPQDGGGPDRPPGVGGAGRAGGGGPGPQRGRRSGHLGDPRRAPALHRLGRPVLGGRRPGGRSGPSPGRRRAGRPLAPGRRRPQAGHSGQGCRRARAVPAGLRERRARRLAPPHPHHGIPASRRRAGEGHRPGHRRRAHRGRAGAPLQGGQHRYRLRGQGGHLHHLLVVAGLRPGHDRRDRAGPGACARSCSPLPAHFTSTPRRSTPPPGSTSGTFPRPSPTWP